MTDDWAAGTYAGLELVRARELARLTPQQRLAWLEEAQELAHASGALARSRDAKQRAIDALWGEPARRPHTRGVSSDRPPR